MNVADCLTLLMGRLGNRSQATLRATCLLEMKLFQEVMEKRPELPWFMLNTVQTMVTVANQRYLAVPSDFVREKDEQPLWLIDSSGGKHKLVKKDYDELVSHYDDEDDDDEASGVPEMYALDGEYFHFFPTPDAVYSIEWKYFAKQTVPADSSGSETGWFKWASDLMIAGAGFQVAGKHIKDPELAQIFAADLAVATKALDDAIVAREEANRERSMG